MHMARRLFVVYMHVFVNQFLCLFRCIPCICHGYKSMLLIMIAVMLRITCVEMYVNNVRSKTTRTDVEPKIVKHTEATALVDGKNALGPVGAFCFSSTTHLKSSY